MDAVEQFDIDSSGSTVSERNDLGLIVAEPDCTDIVRRAAGYPAVLGIARGTGLAHQLELAEILALAEISCRDGLEQFAHNLCGILAENSLGLGLRFEQDFRTRGICDFIIAIGLVVIAVVAEHSICRRHFDSSDSVCQSAGCKGRDIRIRRIIKSCQMERLFHEVIGFVDAEHLRNYSDGHGIERLLDSILDGYLFLASVRAVRILRPELAVLIDRVVEDHARPVDIVLLERERIGRKGLYGRTGLSRGLGRSVEAEVAVLFARLSDYADDSALIVHDGCSRLSGGMLGGVCLLIESDSV